jgi:hypothetical protein
MASLLALRRPVALARLGPVLRPATTPFAVGRRGIFDYQPVKPLGDRIDEPKSYPFVLPTESPFVGSRSPRTLFPSS